MMKNRWAGVKKQALPSQEPGASQAGASTSNQLAIASRSEGPPRGRPKYLTFLLPESGARAKMELLWDKVSSETTLRASQKMAGSTVTAVSYPGTQDLRRCCFHGRGWWL